MLKRLIIIQALLLAFQIILYFGCEKLQHRIHNVERPIDSRIPFMPLTVLIYCLWFPVIAVFPITLFYFDPFYYCSYMIAMVLEIVVSVTCYLIYPTSFTRPEPPKTLKGNCMKLIYKGSYKGLNCAPSLHCSSCYLVIFTAVFCTGMPAAMRIVFIVTAALIVLSTMTTKQHTVIDVLTAVPLFIAAAAAGIFIALDFYIPILRCFGLL